MADDIDIEEHDVLDNPRIKNIFPDITSIKTEVIDYEEEGIVESDTENYETYQEDSTFEKYQENSTLEDVDEEIPSLFQNRIILGTKPSESSEPTSESEDEIPEIIESSVVLEDWGVLLKNNPCYCHSCQILFPTENALDSHKMIAHSFLVAVGRNKAIKSTSKSSISARLKFETSREVLCNHCNQIFPDEIALLKHSYELIPRKYPCNFCGLVFDNEVVSKIHEMTHSNTSNIIIVMRCPICTCHFKFTNKLTSHMSLQHKMELNKLPERVRTNYKCAYCPSIMRDNKTYNSHIGLRHPEFYNKVVDNDSDKFKCLPCNLTFPSAYSEKIHRAAQHASKTPDFIPKRSLDLNKPIKIEAPSPKSSPQKTDYSRRLIPKNTLFKCNKCNIHFISALVAIEHSKRCPIKKGDWKCEKCKRSFKSVDRSFHNKQHEWTDRFKIITVKENLMNELLYKCKSCNVCFDERTFLKYHVQGCIETDSVLCVVCNNSVHENAITKHKRLHNEIDQFTFVDFMNMDHVNSNPIPENINAKVKNPKEKFYYFCPTCRCYMKVNKLPDQHTIGKCRKQAKIICKVCGLTFSRKGYVTHKKTHKNFPRLKLKDLTFRSTQSGKTIKPPFPDFKKCTNCFVKFYSSLALQSHVCNMEEAKTCEYCGEKFSDLAYKLHVPFHEYSGTEKKMKKRIQLSENIPELIKKYESLQIIWNILFLCETCDTILDSYDQVVEHSQDHFCNMESYNVNINHCSTCDLKIVGQCFEKHKKLHAENAVSKSSFKILTYKYDALLSDSWYDMFDTLAKEQVDQILNVSKYKHTRSVRMRLATDGPIDMTLYQCDICKMIIDWIDVSEHARNSNNCNQTSKITCSECQLLFMTRRSHRDFHEKQESTKKAARIIKFNSTQDFYVNDALRSKMNPEGLKFIRCQHCGKLINKAKYQKHILHHKYYESNKNESKTQPKLTVRPKFKKMELTHNFYKCVKCNVCVFRNKVLQHFCSLKSQKRQCPKCHLWFRSSHMYKHQTYHEKFRLTKNNVKVYTFKDGKVDTKTNKVTLYQCSNCSICLHKQESLRRHICMSSNYQKLCPQCEMPFHRTRMQLHRRLHDTRDFSKKDIVVKKFKSDTLLIEGEPELPPKVKKVYKKKNNLLTKPAKKHSKSLELKDKEFLRHLHNRFFKCTCNLLFITAAALIDHVGICGSDNNGVKCPKCKLVFHESEIDIHKKTNKCLQVSLLYIVTLDSDNGMKYDYNWCLYRCWRCDINYVTFRAVFNHVEKGHVIRQKMIQCETCDITLSTRSFPQHKSMHKQFSNFIRGDINMFTVTQMKYSKVLYDTTNTRIDSVTNYEEDPVKITETYKKGVKRKLELKEDVKKHRKVDDSQEKESKILKYDLHHCEICELNFLHGKTFKLHLTGNHKEKQFTCPICRLQFTRYTLTRHLKVHHGKTNYSAKSQDLGSGDEISDHENSIISEAGDEDMVDDSEIPDHNSDNNSLQIEVKQTDKPQDTNKQTDNSNKLYKCSDCDVYFLFPDACRDHVSDHTTLDPTEYIACKICDLQFLCEYLGSHMKCHRQKTFNIDEIIIEEYSFSGGQIKIDSYPAAERLKSKVTTTTYIDESTVDSTVSEVKRDFNDSVVSSGNNENSDVEMKSVVSDTNTELDVRSNFLISSNDNTPTE